MQTKSLRFQITSRILLLSLCIMLLGGGIAIWQARKAVNNEVASSINLALQLVRLVFSGAAHSDIDETDWIYRLKGLKQTRHLDIQLKMPSGRVIEITADKKKLERPDSPPQWFINLVSSQYPKAEYPIKTAEGKLLTLIIQANPMDEITEVWDESIAFFITISLLVVLTFLAVNYVFNKSFKAINTIVDTLKQIETGEYSKKLPDFSTQEYDHIARAINHMTDVLEKVRQQNQSLTQHSLKIQEEERQRLSQELHDELGQSLTAIKVMSATAAHKKADVQRLMQSVAEICDHLMRVVRSMMQQLHPLILTELGLKETLEDLINHWQERNNDIKVGFECDEDVTYLDHSIAIQLFRVVQESLTNISRHARASRVSIVLTIEEKPEHCLHLKISDNGKGFDANHISTGFGLLSMKERVKSLGGEFSIKSNPEQGTTLQITVVANDGFR